MKKPSDILKSLLGSQDSGQTHLLSRFKRYLNAAGIQVIYGALLLYFAYKRPETSGWAKRIILGTIAYVLAPMDAIPDLSPLLGFTDDIGVLMFGLVNIAGYINADVKDTARRELGSWITYEDRDLEAFEKKAGI